MNATIEKSFATIGARVKTVSTRRFNTDFKIDIRRDNMGEFFEIQTDKTIEASILDVKKDDRHLLMLVRLPDNLKAKFLCGHDERHWFTAAIPEKAPVSNVLQAKQALKPKELIELERNEGIKTNIAHKRHRKLKSGRKIHRQGEFMFIPVKDFEPPRGFKTIILRDEPMTGGGSHMHYAEYLYRCGGVTVHVSRMNEKTRNGLTESEYQNFLKTNPQAKTYDWRIMTRDPEVYVKGRISHEEHSTVDLGNVWHKVMVNTEAQAKARRKVAFLD